MTSSNGKESIMVIKYKVGLLYLFSLVENRQAQATERRGLSVQAANLGHKPTDQVSFQTWVPSWASKCELRVFLHYTRFLLQCPSPLPVHAITSIAHVKSKYKAQCGS